MENDVRNDRSDAREAKPPFHVSETPRGGSVSASNIISDFSESNSSHTEETVLLQENQVSEDPAEKKNEPIESMPSKSGKGLSSDGEATQISMEHSTPIVSPGKNRMTISEEPAIREQETRILEPDKASEDDDFDLSDPMPPTVAPEDEETKIANFGPNNDSGAGNSRSRRNDGTKVVELDLSERVMSTISRSSVPLNMSTETLGGYGYHRILRTHQKGGMGRILIAYDQFLKRDIALKELHPEVAEDMSIVRRFIGEAEITAQLEHPGIVPIHTLNLDQDGNPYYTMKLIKGHTFQDAIKAYHRNPSKGELLNLVRRLVSICKTIAFAHSKGVIHRDLKPANIMLGEHGETLVMDWGLAKPLNDASADSMFTSIAIQYRNEEPRPELTMVGAIVGTPAFMSPEQASPEDYQVGPLSDVFSLGTILYYLLAGQTAFSGRSTKEVLSKVRAASPPKPSEIKPNVPPGLEAICAKAMAKELDNRYQSATEMFDDLCRWLDGEPIRAQKETLYKKILRWFDRYRLLSISIPFVLIVVFIATNIGIQADRAARERKRNIAIQSVMSDTVDLTDQPWVPFRSSSGVTVTREERKTGGEMVVCQVDVVPKSEQAIIEIGAPPPYAWNLTQKTTLSLALFEARSDDINVVSNFFVRMGRGSAFYEWQPSPQWWKNRKRGNWFPFSIPLKGSQDWGRTESGEPSMDKIEWIEFHFTVTEPTTFRIDHITLSDIEQ